MYTIHATGTGIKEADWLSISLNIVIFLFHQASSEVMRMNISDSISSTWSEAEVEIILHMYESVA